MHTSLRKLPSVVLLAVAFLAAGCGGGGGPLSAARNLVGTWKASAPATVNFETDFCTTNLSLVASQGWTVTLDITAGANDNSVNVQMAFVTSNSQIIAGCPSTGVTPEVSPMYLTGNISGTRLDLSDGLTPVASFSFTTDQMTGTLDYAWCMAFCQRDYTAANAIVLRRQ